MKQTLHYDGDRDNFVALVNIWIDRYRTEGQTRWRCVEMADDGVVIVQLTEDENDVQKTIVARPGNSILVDLDTGNLQLV